MNIGKAIKLCRKQKNWTLAELADKSHLSTSYISLLEQGKRDPNLSKLENIAKSLKIPLSVLLFLGTDKKEIESNLYTSYLPQSSPDMILRTSGEKRLSGFLMWQSVYSELVFMDIFWPEFRKIDLMRAIRTYQERKRRIGK